MYHTVMTRYLHEFYIYCACNTAIFCNFSNKRFLNKSAVFVSDKKTMFAVQIGPPPNIILLLFVEKNSTTLKNCNSSVRNKRDPVTTLGTHGFLSFVRYRFFTNRRFQIYWYIRCFNRSPLHKKYLNFVIFKFSSFDFDNHYLLTFLENITPDKRFLLDATAWASHIFSGDIAPLLLFIDTHDQCLAVNDGEDTTQIYFSFL